MRFMILFSFPMNSTAATVCTFSIGQDKKKEQAENQMEVIRMAALHIDKRKEVEESANG